MSGLLGEFYTELYRAVHRTLSAIRNNRVSAFQGELYTDSIGPIVRTLQVSALSRCPLFRGVRKAGFHCILKSYKSQSYESK